MAARTPDEELKRLAGLFALVDRRPGSARQIAGSALQTHAEWRMHRDAAGALCAHLRRALGEAPPGQLREEIAGRLADLRREWGFGA